MIHVLFRNSRIQNEKIQREMGTEVLKKKKSGLQKSQIIRYSNLIEKLMIPIYLSDNIDLIRSFHISQESIDIMEKMFQTKFELFSLDIYQIYSEIVSQTIEFQNTPINKQSIYETRDVIIQSIRSRLMKNTKIIKFLVEYLSSKYQNVILILEDEDVIRLMKNNFSEFIRLYRVAIVKDISYVSKKSPGFRTSKDPLFSLYDGVVVIEETITTESVEQKSKIIEGINNGD